MVESSEDKKRDEQLEEIFTDFKVRREELAQAEKSEQDKSLFSIKVRKLLTVFGVGISIVLSLYLLVLVFGKSSPFKSPEPWAIGERFASDYKIDGCILHLWQLKRAVDLYYSDHKIFPKNIEQLSGGGYIKKGFVCPASKKEYIFTLKDNKSVFVCPDPRMHNQDIIDIYCSVINSPPVIER